MRIFGGTFTARLWPTLITLSALVVLLTSVPGKVERLHWKENLITTIKSRMDETPVDVSSLPTDAKDIDYRSARAFGLFQHNKEMYLISVSRTGEGGYHVLTPMRLENGRMLLVDRGWVPYDKKSPFTRSDGPGLRPGAG